MRVCERGVAKRIDCGLSKRDEWRELRSPWLHLKSAIPPFRLRADVLRQFGRQPHWIALDLDVEPSSSRETAASLHGTLTTAELEVLLGVLSDALHPQHEKKDGFLTGLYQSLFRLRLAVVAP